VIHPIIASQAAALASSAPIIRENFRTKPGPNNAGDAKMQLAQAMADRMTQVNAADIPKLKLNPVVRPSMDEIKANPLQGIRDTFAALNSTHGNEYELNPDGSLNKDKFLGETINYNPNADRAIMAHEMGHAVSAKTKIGGAIRNLRDNPKLTLALAAAAGILPVGAAALSPGDDDYDTAIAGSLALATPVLIDEALATKNALAMMETADMRANLGQRGKLAGGLLSYIAGPAVLASMGTAIGNQFDEDIPPTAM